MSSGEKKEKSAVVRSDTPEADGESMPFYRRLGNRIIIYCGYIAEKVRNLGGGKKGAKETGSTELRNNEAETAPRSLELNGEFRGTALMIEVKNNSNDGGGDGENENAKLSIQISSRNMNPNKAESGPIELNENESGPIKLDKDLDIIVKDRGVRIGGDRYMTYKYEITNIEQGKIINGRIRSGDLVGAPSSLWGTGELDGKDDVHTFDDFHGHSSHYEGDATFSKQRVYSLNGYETQYVKVKARRGNGKGDIEIMVAMPEALVETIKRCMEPDQPKNKK